MNATEQAKIRKQHVIRNPVGTGGVTSGIATCACGATWRVFYSRYGMEWVPQNDRCATHDQAMAQLLQEQY